jgi:hypothetical protein
MNKIFYSSCICILVHVETNRCLVLQSKTSGLRFRNFWFSKKSSEIDKKAFSDGISYLILYDRARFLLLDHIGFLNDRNYLIVYDQVGIVIDILIRFVSCDFYQIFWLSHTLGIIRNLAKSVVSTILIDLCVIFYQKPCMRTILYNLVSSDVWFFDLD